MKDYKELIDALDGMDFFCDRAGKELWFDKPKEVQDEDIAFHHKTLIEAISAIEQLCADVARLESENRSKEQYIAETIGKVIKERDAAISDLEIGRKCAFCKNINSDLCSRGCFLTKANWEWRGVQEAENE